MGFSDFLKKMKLDTNEEEEYDEYDDYEGADEDSAASKKSSAAAKEDDLDDFDDDDLLSSKPVKKTSSYSAPKSAPKTSAYTQSSSSASSNVVGMNGTPKKNSGAEVCMIMPKGFEDANTVADILLSHKAVVLNLEGIDIDSAQRFIDFVSGACYTIGGNLQVISKKIFIVVPKDMNLSGDFNEIFGDMIDLSGRV